MHYETGSTKPKKQIEVERDWTIIVRKYMQLRRTQVNRKNMHGFPIVSQGLHLKEYLKNIEQLLTSKSTKKELNPFSEALSLLPLLLS